MTFIDKEKEITIKSKDAITVICEVTAMSAMTKTGAGIHAALFDEEFMNSVKQVEQEVEMMKTLRENGKLMLDLLEFGRDFTSDMFEWEENSKGEINPNPTTDDTVIIMINNDFETDMDPTNQLNLCTAFYICKMMDPVTRVSIYSSYNKEKLGMSWKEYEEYDDEVEEKDITMVTFLQDNHPQIINKVKRMFNL